MCVTHLQRYLAVNRVSINPRSHQRTFKYQEQTLGFIWSTSPQSCSPNKLHFVRLTFFWGNFHNAFDRTDMIVVKYNTAPCKSVRARMVFIMWCLQQSYQHVLFCVGWANSVACFVQSALCVCVCALPIPTAWGTWRNKPQTISDLSVSCVYLPAVWRKASFQDGAGFDTAGRGWDKNMMMKLKKGSNKILFYITKPRHVLLFSLLHADFNKAKMV